MIRPFRLVLICAATLAFGACKQEAAPAPEAAATAPDAKPGLSLTGGRLVLPAVKGNPAAAYFELTNGSDKPAVIAAIDIPGANMAMFHENKDAGGHSTMMDMAPPEVKPGATMTLTPGARHIMVGGLPTTLEPGSSVEMTLTFADGDKLSAPLIVETPGGAN